MENEILAKIDEFLEKTKFKCIYFVVKGERSNKILEIYVDSLQVLDIDELALLNKDLWEMLASNELVKNISKIVVSSPGTERAFKYAWQLEKHIGKVLVIELKDGNIFNGKLLEIVNDNVLVLETIINKKEKQILNLNFDEIQESKVKMPF
jgi:ribosome maturation factor RimP